MKNGHYNPDYQDFEFEEKTEEEEQKDTSFSVRSIQHYDAVFEDFSCHLLAHDEFLKKKLAYKSSKEALNHNFTQFTGELEIDKKFYDNSKVIDNAESMVFPNYQLKSM